MRVTLELVSSSLRLPPRVAWFYLRAQLLARRLGDAYSLQISSRPEDLAPLLAIAKRRRHVVELGTGVGWAVAALALSDRRRHVITYDPFPHAQRGRYLQLLAPAVRARIDVCDQPATDGPAGDPRVELLFIDIGGHTRLDTVGAFMAWRRVLAPDAVVVFHDYGPTFPGVAEAIASLGLDGEARGRSLFVCHAGW